MTVARANKFGASEPPRPLCSGDRMTQEEFHRAYEHHPEGFKAELIGGIVYVSPPLRQSHGSPHLKLGTLFGLYIAPTPGIDGADNATVLLGPDGEPQPDLLLRIKPEYGGQSGITSDDYIEGAPELVAEVALSSRSIDLHAKYEDYRRYGVKEYVVLVVRDRVLRWFDPGGNREMEPDSKGIFRSRLFPGFWLDAPAIVAEEYARAISIMNEGIQSSERSAFVEFLRTARGEH
jgi:Uma2 family endonuclease